MTRDDIRFDIDDLYLTDHVMNQIKIGGRQISAYQIKQAVINGKKENADNPHETLFRDEYPGTDLLVVVDTNRAAVETAYYDDEQGARGGRL